MKFIGGQDMSDQEREILAAEQRRRRIMRFALMSRSTLINKVRRRGVRAGLTWEQIRDMCEGTGYEIAGRLVDMEDQETAELAAKKQEQGS